MKIPFEKYQGTGNDFVIIDNRTLFFDKTNKNLIQQLCNRKFGIGSDGLILIEDHEKYDFNMVFFNPDGSQSFCGNGSRCAVQFAYNLGMIKEHTSFVSTDGWHEAYILGEGMVKLKMNDVKEIQHNNTFDFLHTGSPHYVTFEQDIFNADIVKKGREIRYSDTYKNIGGTNVNFIEKKGKEYIVRTYERGVENETLSCGTGVTACALSVGLRNKIQNGRINIKTKGGDLVVEFNQTSQHSFTNIWLSGLATFVFEGIIKV